MYLTDITPVITWYFQQFGNIATSCFNILNSFSFGGFTFFAFILALGLLNVIIQMVIATPKQSEKNPKGGK